MANKQITYTDIDKQIEKLKLQHLEINDLSFAKEQLQVDIPRAKNVQNRKGLSGNDSPLFSFSLEKGF